MSDVSLRLSVDNCTPPSLSSFLSHFPHLSFLKITTATLRSDGGDDISGFRYRILSPDDISAVADQILLSVASSCPKLTGLRLQYGPVSLFPLLSLSLPHALTSPPSTSTYLYPSLSTGLSSCTLFENSPSVSAPSLANSNTSMLLRKGTSTMLD
ncbi:hypothetical protein RHGRI_022821 [Rhododendron griersonianum]|uniref:Uncharacterized protein n=1 Tax=Rhododendron griersonianum TaxID=479676 RepID=A0AAV6J0X0_9ERIC|nr:hypothetical protein RHGRI_022821 [Rhododendron griersonianum]